MSKKYAKYINEAASHYNLDPILVTAICSKESDFQPQAMRYEDGYKWLFDPDRFAIVWRVTMATEERLQMFSYGLMQIMGATARERGFVGFMPDLCEPEIGLHWGCAHLGYLSKRYRTREEIVAAYNAGSPRKIAGGDFVNQDYVDDVNVRYAKFKAALT